MAWKFEPDGPPSDVKAWGFRIHYGRCPVDMKDRRGLVGTDVDINGEIHEVLAIEANAVVHPPRRGDPIGVAVRLPPGQIQEDIADA